MRSLPLVTRALVAGALTVSLPGCRASSSAEAVPPSSTSEAVTHAPNAVMPLDPHSFARPREVLVRHFGFAWKISFEERRLSGTATMLVERADPTAPLRLDTRDLDIERVQVGRIEVSEEQPELVGVKPVAGWQDAKWRLAAEEPILGSGLEVELPEGANAVAVTYRTAPDATGLQWLEPAQTADKTHPFLYTQSQAIHARSWFPTQDTPSVRVTFDARVEVDRPVQVLMAARAEPQPATNTFRYVMPQPVPSYLLALAAGNLEFKALGERSGVWAEPSVLPRAASEFVDVEQMIETAETLYGPYRWERYDILVLPPAFPFGGMENPRLTFATPTILAGDRSLVALIAHELAHSWSGNLVTNATWDDLWLNESFTVYIERRIVEALYGRERAEVEAVLGHQDLEEDVAELPPADQHLRTNFAGRDPDGGLTAIAYEKGALLLRTLEEAHGREKFDAFLHEWFAKHAFTSVTTDEFVAFAQEKLGKTSKAPPLEAWVHQPGVPEGAYVPSAPVLTSIDTIREAFLQTGAVPTRENVKDWTPQEWLHFLRGLTGKVTPEQLASLDEAFTLTRSGNSEILAEWMEIAVLAGYRPVDARLEQFLVEVGRRKFLMPLYKALLTAERRSDAERIYRSARDGYHPISQMSLDDLLGKPESA